PGVSGGSCGKPQPGPTGLRRLTRFELDNAARDLFGEAGDPASVLPPDDRAAHGFDNGIEDRTVSPLIAEGYAGIAQDLARKATANLPALMGCDPSGAAATECGRK